MQSISKTQLHAKKATNFSQVFDKGDLLGKFHPFPWAVRTAVHDSYASMNDAHVT